NQVERDLSAQCRMGFLESRGRKQRQVFVHEDKKSNGDCYVHRRNPSADFEFLFRWGGSVFILLQFVQLHVRREAQSAEAERHRVTKSHDATDDWPAHPFMLFGEPLQWLAYARKFTGLLAAGDAPGMRRAHHNAFEHGLDADQRLFAAFECGQQLDGYKKTPQ